MTVDGQESASAPRARPGHPEPIFVGGSSRSGTRAMSRLVGAHPRYHRLGVEVRFHAVGLPALLAGELELDAFLERCREEWWRRGFKENRGLQKILRRRDWHAALDRFREDFDADPWEASRVLVRSVLDPVAEQHGKPSWVEDSGQNVGSAPTLLRLFPRARFVNMLRDGRAVVASILARVERTDDPLSALGHWEERVRAADAAVGALPAGTATVIHLEDLAAHDREGSLARLARLLELDDDTPLRAHLDAHITAEGARIGAWRRRMAPADARLIDRRYRRLVRDMRREGVAAAPTIEPRELSLARARIRVPSRSRGR